MTSRPSSQSPPDAHLEKLMDELCEAVGEFQDVSDGWARGTAETYQMEYAQNDVNAARSKVREYLSERTLTDTDLGFLLSGEWGARTCPCQHCIALSAKIDAMLKSPRRSPPMTSCNHFYENVNTVPTCSCGLTREATREEKLAPERIKLNNTRIIK